MLTEEIVSRVKSRLVEGAYASEGNCYEASIAVGILISQEDTDSNIRLIKGCVRGIPHWWLTVDGEIKDPTVEQFDPLPGPEEYYLELKHPIDLREIAWLLREPGN